MSINEQLIGITSDIAAQLAAKLSSQEVLAGAPDAGVGALAPASGAGFSYVTIHFAGGSAGAIALSLNEELAAALTAEGTSLEAFAAEASAASLVSIGASVQPGEPLEADAFTQSATTAITSASVPLLKGETIVGCVASIVLDDGMTNAEFESFGEASRGGTITAMGPRSLDLLNDVEMGVAVELGRARMSVRDILNLTPGSVVELDRAAGSPVDLLVNGTLVARGEVVVIDEEFGIRITDIIGHEDTTKRAG